MSVQLRDDRVKNIYLSYLIPLRDYQEAVKLHDISGNNYTAML